MSHNHLDWAKYQNRHSSKSIWNCSFTKMIVPYTFWAMPILIFSPVQMIITNPLNCSCDLQIFENSRPSTSNFESFSRSLEQFFSQLVRTILVTKYHFYISIDRRFVSIVPLKANLIIFSILWTIQNFEKWVWPSLKWKMISKIDT